MLLVVVGGNHLLPDKVWQAVPIFGHNVSKLPHELLILRTVPAAMPCTEVDNSNVRRLTHALQERQCMPQEHLHRQMPREP